MKNFISTSVSKIFKYILSFCFRVLPLHQRTELENIRNQILENVQVDEIMTLRSDICAIKFTTDLKEICNILVSTQHTRLLVYKEDLDDIIGFIHLKDILKILINNSQFDLNAILRKPIIATSSQKVLSLFNQMREERIHIATVIDEYGGTQGMITIENIIERELGAIADEYDEVEIEKRDIIFQDGAYIVSGRTKINDLENTIQVNLSTDKDEDEYETIAGLIISKMGCVPRKGSKVNIDNKIICYIVEATGRAIVKVKVELIS